jgi:hypothetical protein
MGIYPNYSYGDDTKQSFVKRSAESVKEGGMRIAVDYMCSDAFEALLSCSGHFARLGFCSVSVTWKDGYWWWH